MPTTPTIDEKVESLVKRSRENEKRLQILMIDNRKFAQALFNVKLRNEPVLENGKPKKNRYGDVVTEKMAPKNPLLGQPDLTDVIRNKVFTEAEKGITGIESILEPTP